MVTYFTKNRGVKLKMSSVIFLTFRFVILLKRKSCVGKFLTQAEKVPLSTVDLSFYLHCYDQAWKFIKLID
jgi:hypothetical protein